MVDNIVLMKKIACLDEYLNDLKEVKNQQDLTFAQFQHDKKLRRYVERTLHLTVESCLDIGGHIIADEGFREPVDNKDVFAVLAENSIITSEDLSSLQNMAKFRNVIVHDYAKIEAEIIYNIVHRNLTDIERFVSVIKKKYLAHS